MAKKAQPSMGCGYVVFVILLAVGLGLLGLSVGQWRDAGGAGAARAVVPGVIGALLFVGALVYLRFARNIVAGAEAEQARRRQFPNEPWKWPKQWQGPAIESNEGGGAIGMWVFALFWNAISIPAAVLVTLDRSASKGAYFVYVFPLVGFFLVWGAIYQTIRWRKYGRARFVPSSLPGVLGGYLGGVIEVPAQVQPEADAQLALKCVRRETRGSGKNRRTTDNVLWEREESIARNKWLSAAGGTRIPVLFYIPPECAATDGSDANNEIVWRLSAAAATPGVDFATQFNVPVFVTGETAAPPEAGAPLLEEYSARPLDRAALQACGVRHELDTFHFSSVHMTGTRLTTAVLMLGILALLAWYVTIDAHAGVWAVTIFFGLIIALFALDVWCDKFELHIEAREVVGTKRRPWGTKVTRVPRAEAAQVRYEKSLSSGENQYFRLRLVGTEGVDPGAPALAGENFAAQKLRRRLEQLKQQGSLTPAKLKELSTDVYAQLQRTAKFSVVFAKHIPGQARAEAVGALVMEAIQKQ
ncbi:MAG TPA: hypothetical protein VHN79_06875 [Lacunisphaera sp.]|nr:hypothetical protein [Lacunisphaera sp.]